MPYKYCASDSPRYCATLFANEVRKQRKRLTGERVGEIIQLCRNSETPEDVKLAARNELVTDLVWMVMKEAKRHKDIPYDDAVSEGCLMLVRTVDDFIEKYDANKTDDPLVIFQYCNTAVKHNMRRFAAQSTVNDPNTRKRLRHKRIITSGKAHTLSPTLVKRAEVWKRPEVVSLGEETGKITKDGNIQTFGEVIPNPAAPTPEHLYGTVEGRQVVIRLLRRHTNLSQFRILTRFFGFRGEPKSFGEIAKELGRSAGGCKTSAMKAYAKLRTVEGFEPLLRLLVSPERIYGRHKIARIPPADLNVTARHDRACALRNRKLQPEQVREIRKRSAAGKGRVELAKEFGVSPQLISHIKTKRCWKDA